MRKMNSLVSLMAIITISLAACSEPVATGIEDQAPVVTPDVQTSTQRTEISRASLCNQGYVEGRARSFNVEQADPKFVSPDVKALLTQKGYKSIAAFECVKERDGLKMTDEKFAAAVSGLLSSEYVSSLTEGNNRYFNVEGKSLVPDAKLTNNVAVLLLTSTVEELKTQNQVFGHMVPGGPERK